MELTLSVDPAPVSINASEAKPAEGRTRPGTDADDPATQAFASLLATMLAAVPPPPPEPEAEPDAAAVPALAEGVVAATDLTAALALPAPADPAVPAVPAVPVSGLPVPPATTPIPVAVSAAAVGVTPAPVVVAAPAADAPVDGQAIDPTEVVAAPAGPVAAPAPAPAPSARAEVVPIVPVVAPIVLSSDLTGEGDLGERRDAPAAAPVPGPAAAATNFPPVQRAESVVVPPAPTPAPATPAAQVVRAVAPLRNLGDGNHNVVLELHPAELGAVRVELTLNAGIVHLGLQAEHAATGQLLRSALPELRSQLDAAGLVAGRLAVDSGQSGPGNGQVPWRTGNDGARNRSAGNDDDSSELPVPIHPSAAPGRVDVRL